MGIEVGIEPDATELDDESFLRRNGDPEVGVVATKEFNRP